MKPIFHKVAAGLALLLVAGLAGGCGNGGSSAPSAPATNPAPVVATAGADIKSITLPDYEPDLPDGPGRAEFMQSCLICHSPDYITTQPPFPRQIWEHEVAKMVTNYGAPANPEQMRKIVDYLVAIRGSQTGSAAQ